MKHVLHLFFFLFCMSTPTGVAYATGHLEEGNNHYRNGDYHSAMVAYRKAVAAGENRALALFNAANASYQTGNSAAAVAYYELSVADAPDFGRCWQNLGILYYELGDCAAAIAALDRVQLLEGDTSVTVQLVLASAHKDLEHYGPAATFLEKAIERDSTVHDAYLMLYEIARATGDRREALMWLDRYPSGGRRSYEVLQLSGELHLENSDTAAALTCFRKCTRSEPRRSGGWFKLVNLLHRMGATFTALEEARTALASLEKPESVSLLAGRIAFEGGYYRRAEEFYERCIRLGDPDGFVGMNNLYAVYDRLGDTGGKERIQTMTTIKNNGSDHGISSKKTQ
jgi:tetratricopeptide (TPR) repeat protein